MRIEKLENQLYENSTNNNMIIIHRSIWRAADFVKFPRFLFHPNEKIVEFTIKFGTAYIRTVNLNLANR